METADVLGAVTVLISVLMSGLLAWLTLRHSRKESDVRRSHELYLAFLPRRIDAFEKVWKILYDIEASGTLEPQQVDYVVESSLWLPPEVRSVVLQVVIDPQIADAAQLKHARDCIERMSGATRIQEVQAQSLGT